MDDEGNAPEFNGLENLQLLTEAANEAFSNKALPSIYRLHRLNFDDEQE